jgi:hypothetical protein
MSVTGNHPGTAQSPGWPESTRIPVRVDADPRWSRHVLHSALAHWCARQIDRELASGLSPRASSIVQRRAAQLTGVRSRRRIAAGLARVLRDCTRQPLSMTAVVSPDRHEVLAARAVLQALALRLADSGPVDPRGMAILQVLLTDGTGPLYEPVGPGSLGSHLRAAAAALEPEAR